jgi:hypothetical protein
MAITDDLFNRLQNNSLFIDNIDKLIKSTEKGCCCNVDCDKALGLGEQKQYTWEDWNLKILEIKPSTKIPTREEIEKKIVSWSMHDILNDCYVFYYGYTCEDGYKIESRCSISIQALCAPTLLDDEDRVRKQRAAKNELIDKVLKHYNEKYSKEEYGMTGSEFKKFENDIRMINGDIVIEGLANSGYTAHIKVPFEYLKYIKVAMPTIDFCVSKWKDAGNWIEGLPAIKKIETYNDRVTKVTFIDNTFTKSVCSENDHFDEDVGITICCMKRLFGKDGNRMYNDMIRKAHKVIDENNKKKEAEAKEKAERKLKTKKATCKKAAKKLLEKQEQIDIQTQAIIKAHRMLEDERREEGLI